MAYSGFDLTGKTAVVVGGTSGIGLAICRGLVEAHGGHLQAANRTGGGAVFRVALSLPTKLHTGDVEHPLR